MPFTNKYVNPAITVRYSEEFLENGIANTYSLGVSQEYPIIVKSDVAGNTLWERRISLAENNGMRLNKVIQLTTITKVVKYVASASYGPLIFLFSFDQSGRLLWTKKVTTNGQNLVPFLESVPASSDFYLAFSDPVGTNKSPLPAVMKFDSTGTILLQKLLGTTQVHTGFVINTAKSHANGLALAGALSQSSSTKGWIVDLTTLLAISTPRLVSAPTGSIQQIMVSSAANYVVTGYTNSDGGGVFISRINGIGAKDLYLFPSTVGYLSALTGTSESFYAAPYNATNGKVYKLAASNFATLWVKQLKEAATIIPVRTLVYRPETTRLTSTIYENAYAISTDSELSSCLTETSTGQTAKKTLTVAAFEASAGTMSLRALNVTPDWIDQFSDPESVCGNGIELTNALLQSSHLYLQSAGSTGVDSTQGIHLRWLLKGALSKHLPKADYAVAGVNFNKADDFVRIYRAPHQEIKVGVNLTTAPQLVDDANAHWIYKVGTLAFDVWFRNTTKYASVRASINPATNPSGFLTSYGAQLIEVEQQTELAYAVTLNFSTPTATPSTVAIELLSVEENTITSPKKATFRKKYTTTALTGKKLTSENIRSIRLRANATIVGLIEFEFYSRFISAASEAKKWDYLGKHALTLDTSLAFYRLEPIPNSVHSKWLRYNDGAKVNIDNYKTKWNSPLLDADTRIQDTVEQYISLSNTATNPEAIETIYFNDPSATPIPGYEPDPDFDPSENQFDLSNLYVLQLASMDYHIARMMGLGILDLNAKVNTGKFMYLAEYITYADLGDGKGAREVRHMYCSLPTGQVDQRLPIAVDLKAPVPGIFQDLGTEAPSLLTDADGYSPDGKSRFISLFNEDLPEEAANAPFFYHNYEFISAEATLPVYAGIEYRTTGDAQWRKPELPFDKNYFNIDPPVTADKRNETKSIVIPDPGYPVYVHREKSTGWHDYGSYGINWFSRATSSPVIHSIETVIVPENLLQPPTNINAVLIRKESPLLLTSPDEQTAYNAITNPDKTFIRLSFDYNHGQELIDYHKEINGELINGYTELPDSEELFAENIQTFFRNEIPNSVSGKIVSVTDDSNPLLSVITTGDYILISAGSDPDNTITPEIPSGLEPNFLGSALTVDGMTFIIHQIDNTGTYPEFTVFKNDANGYPIALSSSAAPGDLTSPATGGLFIAVENMLSPASWNAPNPLSFEVKVDLNSIFHETVMVHIPDGTIETHVQKFRGVYENALIEKVLEDNDGDPGTPMVHLGMYKLTFINPLAQHSQAAGPGHRVEWYKGVARVHTVSQPNGPRKALQVLRTENIGTASDLVIYAVDSAFDPADSSYDEIQIGTHPVNYYPGYRMYLYEDTAYGLDEPSILPGPDEDIRYSIFGLRSQDLELSYVSKISQPVLMFAQKIEEPLAPRVPVGGLYTTRPDFFGKASYTFTTIFDHKPYSVQFGRASDVQILTSFWRDDVPSNPLIWTVQRIQDEIFERGEAAWYAERWQNLLGFDYTYPSDPANNGQFERFPDSLGTSLPLPNNQKFIDSINAFIVQHNSDFGTSVPPVSTITSLFQVVIPSGPQNAELQIWNFVQDVIHNCFVPLTGIPVIYQYVNGPGYTPMPKKQVIRDEKGDLLKPDDSRFDMAPMMKIIGPDPLALPPKTEHETQFTDFNIDGSSNAKYFYISREFSLQMKTGPYSPILGPINLVNAAPPRAPEIVKIVPILENRNVNILPAIELQLNSYAEHQHIRRVTVLRATSMQDALSVRTMQKVKVIDFATEPLTGETWSVQDDFSDLTYVPYGDPLFYVVTVDREVKYNDRDGNPVTEYQPSEPSKLTVTNIVENYNPESPDMSFTSDPPNVNNELESVELSWNKTVHNGKYHLQKRNEKGNWIEIAVVQDNSSVITIALEDTDWNSDTLALENADGNRVYHVFKVVAENFAGMLSRDEKILSI